jgi:hypothetical protein
MEAYLNTFTLPPGITAHMVATGTGSAGRSYVIQCRYTLPDGTVLCADHPVDQNHYSHPEGRPGRGASIATLLAVCCGQLCHDHFEWLNRTGHHVEMILKLEPSRQRRFDVG